MQLKPYIVVRGSYPPFTSIHLFLEIQDVPIFYRPINLCIIFYPQSIVILEEYLQKLQNELFSHQCMKSGCQLERKQYKIII